MKTIGLLGGMSWESTIPYYRHINEEIRHRLGGLHSARLILYSVDFQVIETLQRNGRWPEAGLVLASAAASLERAGAECIVLCTNTMHRVASEIESAISIPLLHIADATALAVKQSGIGKVGLLGTRFTMEQDFYVGRLREEHGLEITVPEANDRAEIHRIIYEELCLGQIRAESRNAFHRIIGRLVGQGAQGVILGCTELSLLIDGSTLAVPAFDTTALHARFAVEFAVPAGTGRAPAGTSSGFGNST